MNTPVLEQLNAHRKLWKTYHLEGFLPNGLYYLSPTLTYLYKKLHLCFSEIHQSLCCWSRGWSHILLWWQSFYENDIWCRKQQGTSHRSWWTLKKQIVFSQVLPCNGTMTVMGIQSYPDMKKSTFLKASLFHPVRPTWFKTGLECFEKNISENIRT